MQRLWTAAKAKEAVAAADSAAPWQAGYGFASILEWWAELFAVRVITNRAPGEQYVWAPAARKYQPRLAQYLCGYDAAIYADVMQLLTTLFYPYLQDPSPPGSAWGLPPA